MVKKFVEDKNEVLLLAAQAIESSEDVRMKRPSRRPNEQPATPRPKNKYSHRSRKLDLAKLAVKQEEKKRRLARRKSRQAEDVVLNTENLRPSDIGGKPNSANSKATSSDTQPAPERPSKRVAFV
ncbi:unnamed protein product [Rhizoctonia solani]|uniref:Uncharacterized protein n=1 Tax=Rhizoctonia solani TaxID=456999 RepID=A0A8H3B4P7_9AGAM|nr:unnamed protein product [Rhizoctonia solani]